jgi:hypothetical protein
MGSTDPSGSGRISPEGVMAKLIDGTNGEKSRGDDFSRTDIQSFGKKQLFDCFVESQAIDC